MFAHVASNACAVVVIQTVCALPIIDARRRRAFVNIGVTVGSRPSYLACTRVPVDPLVTSTIMLTGRRSALVKILGTVPSQVSRLTRAGVFTHRVHAGTAVCARRAVTLI